MEILILWKWIKNIKYMEQCQRKKYAHKNYKFHYRSSHTSGFMLLETTGMLNHS